MREVRDLSLNADLVTLSACDTGVGPLEGEEGIANLVRAFLFAGAKSVVASLWTANDPSTRTLMGSIDISPMVRTRVLRFDTHRWI